METVEGNEVPKQDNPEVKEPICMCGCHVIGATVMHFMPCCDRTYEKYINADGSGVELKGEVKEESQEIWRELIDMYDLQDASSYGYGVLIKKLSEKFTITRK